MMRSRLKRTISVCFIILALWLLPASVDFARSETNAIILDRADASNTFSMTGSTSLTALIQNVQSRIVLQFSNATHTFPITTPSASLITLLQNTQDKVTLQFANASHTLPITVVPAGLMNLLQSAEDRFVLEYANAARTFGLTYPFELIGDTVDPVIVAVNPVFQGGGLTLTVETEEYTTAMLQLGSSPGNYTTTLTDDQYRYEHSFSPTGIQAGQTYYYRLTVTDRSGNITVSPEGTLKAATPLFMPLLSR